MHWAMTCFVVALPISLTFSAVGLDTPAADEALAGRLGGSRETLAYRYDAIDAVGGEPTAQYVDSDHQVITVTFADDVAIQFSLARDLTSEEPSPWTVDEAIAIASGLLPADSEVLPDATYERLMGDLILPCHSAALTATLSPALYEQAVRFGQPGDCQMVLSANGGGYAGITVELGDGVLEIPSIAGSLTAEEHTYLDDITETLARADRAVLAFTTETMKPSSYRDASAISGAIATWSELAQQSQGFTASVQLEPIGRAFQTAMDLLDQAAIDITAAAEGIEDAAQRWQYELRESDVIRAQLRAEIVRIRSPPIATPELAHLWTRLTTL